MVVVVGTVVVVVVMPLTYSNYCSPLSTIPQILVFDRLHFIFPPADVSIDHILQCINTAVVSQEKGRVLSFRYVPTTTPQAQALLRDTLCKYWGGAR